MHLVGLALGEHDLVLEPDYDRKCGKSLYEMIEINRHNGTTMESSKKVILLSKIV